MKILLTLLAFIITLSASAQTDSIVYHAPTTTDTVLAYRIDTAIIYGEGSGIDTVTSDSNYVWFYYHYTQTTGDSFLYQPQFVVYDDQGNPLLPNVDLTNAGWLSSGTKYEIYIDSAKAAQTSDSLREFYIFPILKSVYGTTNVTKL